VPACLDSTSAWTHFGPAPRAELLHVLMLTDFERADRIGEFWGYPKSRAFAELLIDCEEDRTLRALLVRVSSAVPPMGSSSISSTITQGRRSYPHGARRARVGRRPRCAREASYLPEMAY
jgi:hypothetical protein